MKFSRVIPLVILFGGSYAAEPVPGAPQVGPKPSVPTPAPNATVNGLPPGLSPFPGDATRLTPPKTLEGAAWLGFKVSKPDETTRAHLPELPFGMGFVVQSVDAKGPAEGAGLQPLDVVWKFGDQLLVNEGQLAVLLRTKKPGEVVKLAVFRSGKEMEVPLTLGAFPLNRRLVAGPVMDSLVTPAGDSDVVTRIINRESRTATLSDEEGKAALKRLVDGTGYELEIRDNAGEVIFNGNLPPNCDVTTVPAAWKSRVWILRRGLDNVLDGRMENVRPPRPRVVPPPAPKEN